MSDFSDRYDVGAGALGILFTAAGKGRGELLERLIKLSDEQAVCALALLAHAHALATAGGARYVPDQALAELVLEAADQGGFTDAYRVADAFTTSSVRAALGNLYVAVGAQLDRVTRAATEAPLN